MPRYRVKVEAQYRSYAITRDEEVRADSAMKAVGDTVYDILDILPVGARVTGIELTALRPIGD